MFLILHNGIFMNVHYMFDIHVAVKIHVAVEMYACIAFNLLYRTQMYKFCLLWYCSGVVTCMLIDSSYSLLCKFFNSSRTMIVYFLNCIPFIYCFFFPLFCTFSIKTFLFKILSLVLMIDWLCDVLCPIHLRILHIERHHRICTGDWLAANSRHIFSDYGILFE